MCAFASSELLSDCLQTIASRSTSETVAGNWIN
jgi:hypothetical protein